MRVAEGAFVAVNPSPTARTDLVELEVLAANSPVGAPLVAPDGSPAPTQDLGVLERVVDDVALEAGEVVPYLRRRMHARELYTYQVNGYALEGTAAETIVILDVIFVAAGFHVRIWAGSLAIAVEVLRTLRGRVAPGSRVDGLLS